MTATLQTQSNRRARISRSAARRGAARSGVVAALVGLALIVMIAGGWWLMNATATGSADDADTPQWEVVRFEPIPITAVADGDLVAKDQVDIVNIIEHKDDERIKRIVEEGTWVEAGDFLYELSAPGLVTDFEQQVAKVRESEAELEEARANLEIEVDVAASAEAKALLELELARLSHQQWEQGTHRQRLNDLALALEKADRELKLAQNDLKFSKELFAEDFISASELEQDEIRLIESENALKTARLDIEVYDQFEKVKAEKEMLSDITQAEEELVRTRSKNRNKLKLLEAKVISEENELIQRRARLEELDRMTDAMVVTAPVSGIAMYSSTIGSRRERWYPMRRGAEVRGGWRVMVITNTKEMLVNLYVHESRINDIEVGQKVAVTVNARPDEVFIATVVEKKNSAMQESSSNPHLRQYQVIAEMPPNLGEGIRPGMNCSAEIFIREIPKALAVPIQSVHTEGDTHFVYVPAEGGKVRKQPIEIGGASDTLVQVTAGVQEGVQVLLRNPKPGELIRDAPVPASTPVIDKQPAGETASEAI
ncbi:MAG: efflux RND transporter periplasmic adaptor subunit [Phycisphaeraceae bacterium]